MSIQDLLHAIKVGEDLDWEFKSAKGGLPRSLWESYVAMANTDGGHIVLGVEDDGVVSGLGDAAKMQTNFWNTINNRGHVSINLLTDQNVRIETIESKDVLVIAVPRADRRQRPVFLGQNPLTGTFRRNFEGDYRCSEQEVRRMLADQSETPADSLVLPGFGMDDLNEVSLNKYRNRFSAVNLQHPWVELDNVALLTKLGGWQTERDSQPGGLTVAGLMMFGKDEAIRDPNAVPQYHIDYREKFSDDPDVRWTDRITIDGTWVGNLYEFYQRVIGRLTVDLKVPFQMQPDLFRKDDTIVHEAVRESLVNALIHADFRGQGGVIIENYGHRFEMSNPGTLLLSRDQLQIGGVSECRNKSLQKMFQMIGSGEQLGSGIDKIWRGWKSQHWRSPMIRETQQPDRVILALPMVSLLPETSVGKLRRQFGTQFTELSEPERLAIVTADVEGSVSNSRLQEICDLHPSDITQLLQKLCKGFLNQKGRKRGTFYVLKPVPSSPNSDPSSPHKNTNSPESAPNSPHLGSSSPNKEPSSPNNDPSSPNKGPSSPDNDPSSQDNRILTDPALIKIAGPSQESKRIPPEQTEQIIVELCRGRFLTHRQIAGLLDRQAQGIKDRFISKLLKAGKLKTKYEDPTNPNQAYTTVDQSSQRSAIGDQQGDEA
jgi:ATP-dependent DNA helicase RecG